MVQLISDVLDVSRMEGEEMKLQLAEWDLGAAVEEAISLLKPLLEGREVRFKRPGSPATVLADREIISRVIQNLLGNAIKFSPKDGGIIKLRIETAGNRIAVSVSDNGPGIAPEYRQKIFDKFAQVELPAGRQKHSTGLGLTFCKLAVEAHGGKIGVDSEEGKGSSFWFELPANGPGPRKETARSPGSQLNH